MLDSMGKGKITVLYGPRQVGKTTLVKKIISLSGKLNPLYLNYDEPDVRKVLTDKTST